MSHRMNGISLLCGVLCLGVQTNAENLSTLMTKGRDAFKTGNYEDAEIYHRLAVKVTETQPDSHEHAEALGDLGGVLLARAQYSEAKKVSLEALRILREMPLRKHLPVVLNNLGAVSIQIGAYGDARSYLEESYRRVIEINPGDPYLARVLNNLGVLLYATGENRRAEEDFKKAINVIETELGSNRAELVPILTNLGSLYVSQKKWKAAETAFDKALSLLAGSPGPNLAGVLDSIGTMHLGRRDFTAAQKAFQEGYILRRQSFGSTHPAVASSAANLAAAMRGAGRFSEAEVLYREALQIYEEAVGSQSHGAASTLEKLAELFRETERKEESEAMAARARDIRFELEHVVDARALR